jgi:di/tricarboxylate transporter
MLLVKEWNGNSGSHSPVCCICMSVCDEVYSAARNVTQFILPSKQGVPLFFCSTIFHLIYLFLSIAQGKKESAM